MIQKCCKGVRISGLSFYREKPCGRTARVERDGKYYCLMHDPVRCKMKSDKRDAAWRANYNARMKAANHKSSCVIACAGMADPVTMVNALRGFVIQCANDRDDRVSPGVKSEAQKLLAYVNPRSNEPQESQSTEWPGSSNLC